MTFLCIVFVFIFLTCMEIAHCRFYGEKGIKSHEIDHGIDVDGLTSRVRMKTGGQSAFDTSNLRFSPPPITYITNLKCQLIYILCCMRKLGDENDCKSCKIFAYLHRFL